jgi:F-type H+-transporting ATPase subunit a
LKKITTLLIFVLTIVCYNQTLLASEPTGEDTHSEDPIEAMMHHLGDANEFHIVGDISIPLPCIAWSEDGFMFTLSSSFEHGHKAVNGFVMNHGILMRVMGDDFPRDQTVAVHLGKAHDHGHNHEEGHDHAKDTAQNTDEEHALVATYVNEDGTEKAYELEACMSLQNTSSTWQDLSISKNVFAMLLALIVLMIVFSKIAKAYTTRTKEAPKGLQSLMEPIILFMRDEVVKPAVGEVHWKRFFPFIMCMFFFILFCNLLGLIPFFPGSANVTGNIGVTMVLALFVFILVNINGTKDYWMHILWMPGVPTAVKPLLAIIEIMSLFIKPATLFIRLFANITAGHVIILSLVSLIFFFNNAMGAAGAGAGMFIAIPFVFAMNLLELFVAFLQAFVFALLTALYLGSAVEVHDDHEHAH